MSQYCQELIQEARFLREQGQLKIGDRRKVEKLQQEVEELEDQLENRERTRIEPGRVLDEETVQKVLGDNYRELDDLLEKLLEEEVFQQEVKTELGLLLYELGNQGEAAFRRGWGWKTVNGGDTDG